MSLIFVRPGQPMVTTSGQVALYEPLPTADTGPALGSSASPLTSLVAGVAGWWDGSKPEGLVSGTAPVSTWNAPGTALIDLSGSSANLIPFNTTANSTLPQGSPHLSGLLGGVGYPVAAAGLLQPALHADFGWQVPGAPANAASSWTWLLVWSRPNWRQGSRVDANPITLMTIGAHPVLQVDSKGGNNRLVLFPGAGEMVVSSSITRRHTHSVLIRYSPVSGTDLWLDDAQVAQSVQWTSGAMAGPVILLHDGTPFGAAQCWLHEAAKWTRTLSDSEVSTVLTYTTRWARGPRKGIYLLVNGQSNAVNYAMNDGAAAVLARGLAWFLGALAYNVLASTGSATSYTMQSGHGIYDVVSAGYPGSFLMDPGDGSDPSEWSLGADGLAVKQAVTSLPSEDLSDICAVIWPWNETDSLRQYSEYAAFRAAAVRFLSLLRAMLGDTSNNVPLVWWNAIPYGSAAGITMHRQVVHSIASDVSQNVIIGNSQTTDSNPRGSVWDPNTGTAVGGDAAHRDSADNLRFAMLATPIIARALAAGGYTDTIAAIPHSMPKGGPSIAHVYRQTDTTLIITVTHDGGNDLKVPLQAADGVGFAVMAGGSPSNPGAIITATSCDRIDATHLQVALSSRLQQPSAACQLFYPYGNGTIGRGNAVTDNFSDLSCPEGWDPSANLGPAWRLDWPLAATFGGVALSDTPD